MKVTVDLAMASKDATKNLNEVHCSYKSRKCLNPRALKRNGRMHTLCEFHRARQNEHQRKSDRKHKDTKSAKHLMKQCALHPYDQDDAKPIPFIEIMSDSHGDTDDVCGQDVTSATTQPACTRTRKSWDQYTNGEKIMYLQAIELSMDRGYYRQFISIHQDQLANAQAHGTCVFIFWHRRFLLGFENMLRSMNTSFRCITIPYYDYVQHNLAYINQECTSIESCSPILRDFGGTQSTINSRSPIGGISLRNFQCVNAAPLNHFCDDTPCARCVPRGRWSSTYFSPDINFNSVKQAIFSGSTIAQVSNDIEQSAHNAVHNMLSGAMGNRFVSPAEPIFYSHHATIDLLHAIYYKCRVKPLGLTEEAKRVDLRIFQGCAANQRPILESTNVLMRGLSSNLTEFFEDVPSTYGSLTDSTNLGNFSYNYELSGLLGDLFSQCELSGTSGGALEERRLTYHGGVQHTVKPIRSPSGISFMAWRHSVYQQALLQNIQDSEHEIDKMMVMLYANCLPGAVQDYSSEFKSMWNVQEVAPSKKILDAVLNGSDPIAISNWTALNEKYFHCPGN